MFAAVSPALMDLVSWMLRDIAGRCFSVVGLIPSFTCSRAAVAGNRNKTSPRQVIPPKRLLLGAAGVRNQMNHHGLRFNGCSTRGDGIVTRTVSLAVERRTEHPAPCSSQQTSARQRLPERYPEMSDEPALSFTRRPARCKRVNRTSE